MKNILGKTENLAFYNKEGKMVYEFNTYSYGFSRELIRDSRGNVLTYKNSNDYSYEYTRDSNGKELTYKDSNGYSHERTYDSNGKELTYKDSSGFSHEWTYDANGRQLTYKNSNGISRGFDIPEYTMEELVAKLGNFKIKN